MSKRRHPIRLIIALLAAFQFAQAESGSSNSHTDQLLNTLKTETQNLEVLKATIQELKTLTGPNSLEDATPTQAHVRDEMMRIWGDASASYYAFLSSMMKSYPPDDEFRPDRFGADIFIYLHGNAIQHLSGMSPTSDLFEVFNTKDTEAKRAIVMWLDQYFLGIDPSFSVFPMPTDLYQQLTPPENSASQMRKWQEQYFSHMGFMLTSPMSKLLAHLKFASRPDENASSAAKELQGHAKKVWSKIHRDLKVAASGPVDQESGSIGHIRHELASRWLQEVEEITTEWNRQILTAPPKTGERSARELRGHPDIPDCGRFLNPKIDPLQ